MRINQFISNNKKVIAREFLFVSVWLAVSCSTVLITTHFKSEYFNESAQIERAAEESYIDYCEETYNFLEEKNSLVTNPHTLKSFTQKVKSNQGYLKEVYDDICFNDSKFKNKHSLREFSELINTTTFFYQGKQFTNSEKDELVSSLENKIQALNSVKDGVFNFGFSLLFPLRAFVYLLIWAYKILVN